MASDRAGLPVRPLYGRTEYTIPATDRGDRDFPQQASGSSSRYTSQAVPQLRVIGFRIVHCHRCRPGGQAGGSVVPAPPPPLTNGFAMRAPAINALGEWTPGICGNATLFASTSVP